MQNVIKNLLFAASLALLASCASTQNGEEQTDATQQDATAQEGVTSQPGQEAYSYAYGEAPSSDSYDTSGSYGGGNYGGRAGGRSGRAGAGGAASSDRIVYFNFDSSEILPQSRTTIEANARTLAGNRRVVTQLEGHTDERGSREYNIALGERRANAVRQAMSAMGVSPQQIRVLSYGKERPAASGHDEQSWALNRRVEIVY